MIRLEHDVGTSRLKICVGLALEKLLEYVGKTSRSPVWLAALVLHPKFKWQNIDQLWQHQAQRSLYTASRVRVQRLWLTQYKNQIRPTISEEVPRDVYDSTGTKISFTALLTLKRLYLKRQTAWMMNILATLARIGQKNRFPIPFNSGVTIERFIPTSPVWLLISLLFRPCHQNVSVHLAKLAILSQHEGAI